MLSDVVGAWEVLFSAPFSDTDSYNFILRHPGENPFLDDAYIIMRKICAEKMAWNKASYLGMFGFCARQKLFGLGRQLHNKLLKSDVELDHMSVGNALLKMYVKCGFIRLSGVLFESLKARNVVSYETLMAGSSDQGDFELLFILFSNMLIENIAPNESIFSLLLNASGEVYSVSNGNVLHAIAQKTGFRSHKKVEDGLISMYLRTGNIKSAEKVFLGTTYRDTGSWNRMLCGYFIHGFSNKVLSLFQEMLKSGEDPNDVTFVPVLNACVHLGLVEEGFYYLYELMKQKGVEPGLIHYRAVMRILIRVGRLAAAYQYLVSTPTKYDNLAWGAFYNAPDFTHYNSTRYTDDAATSLCQYGGVPSISEVFGKKNHNDIVIEPGVCWFEGKKKHIYMCRSVVKGDPTFVEFHEEIKPLFASIKAEACTSDHVVHNVKDEMKEDCDGYHSEQLAVAYALVNLPESGPICIIKRSGIICEDCHSLMKLISKARKRLITVKDANYFHHFQDGSCSCGDYW